jgi:AcrR family transcriptional regulator
MDEQIELPASLALAWGLRERPTRGPKRGLSLDRIVAAAVKVAESDGLAAVSMSRVAGELGASTMSLYRYVDSKDELLALMMDAGIGPPPSTVAPAGGWRAGLTEWARAERAGLHRQPWVVHVPISAPPLTPNQIVWMEWGLVCLRGTGLTADQKISVIMTLSCYVWRMTMVEVDLIAAGNGSLSGYGQILAKLADPRQFPEVHAAIAEGAFDDGDDDPDREFTFGLERVLDGVEALITSG